MKVLRALIYVAAGGVTLVLALLFGLMVLLWTAEDDVAERFVTPEALTKLDFVAGGSMLATCFIGVYKAPSDKPPDLLDQIEPWSADDLVGRLSERDPDMSYVTDFVRQCWDRDVADALGSEDFPGYVRTAQLLMAYESSEQTALFDPRRRLFIAISP